MDKIIAEIVAEMMHRNQGDIRRIEHSLKVFSYAQTMGRLEELSEEHQQILEVTAILHDIGIHVAEANNNTSTAKLQELLGPPVAREIMEKLELPFSISERVCFIISKHHTFTAIDDIVFQLLVEADFLVNSVEDKMNKKEINTFAGKIFKTKSGLHFLNLLFPDYC
jgi:HD superfamily phosphodiesterase